jgi:hypothetical protein
MEVYEKVAAEMADKIAAFDAELKTAMAPFE